MRTGVVLRTRSRWVYDSQYATANFSIISNRRRIFEWNHVRILLPSQQRKVSPTCFTYRFRKVFIHSNLCCNESSTFLCQNFSSSDLRDEILRNHRPPPTLITFSSPFNSTSTHRDDSIRQNCHSAASTSEPIGLEKSSLPNSRISSA